jgi:hypothetical protein
MSTFENGGDQLEVMVTVGQKQVEMSFDYVLVVSSSFPTLVSVDLALHLSVVSWSRKNGYWCLVTPFLIDFGQSLSVS